MLFFSFFTGAQILIVFSHSFYGYQNNGMSVNKYGILHTHTQTKVERECRRERKKSMHTQNKTPKKHSDKMKMNEKWFMFNVAWKIFRWLFCLYADILWRKCRTFITWFCVVAFISSFSLSIHLFRLSHENGKKMCMLLLLYYNNDNNESTRDRADSFHDRSNERKWHRGKNRCNYWGKKIPKQQQHHKQPRKNVTGKFSKTKQ